MQYWQNTVSEDAPKRVRDFCRTVTDWLFSKGVGYYPRLIGVTCLEAESPDEIIFEIAPNFHYRITCLIDSLDRDSLNKIVKIAITATEHAERLLPAAHAINQELRRLVAGAQGNGLPVRMHRVDLTDDLHRWPGDEPQFYAGVYMLGENLSPQIFWLQVSTLHQLRKRFTNELTLLAQRHQRLIELGQEGADGTIDAFAIEVVANNPVPHSIIRQLGECEKLQVSAEITLHWDEGHVYSVFHDPTLSWNRNLITIFRHQIPDTIMDNAIGRPVSHIVEHRGLSSNMIIRSIETDGRSNTRILLDLPTFHFDTVTGVWW